MISVTLPRLAGTRDSVRELLDGQGVPDRLDGREVVVYCRDLASGSPSYADELVHQVVEVRGGQVVLVGAPPVFAERVAAAAARRGRGGALHARSAAQVLI